MPNDGQMVPREEHASPEGDLNRQRRLHVSDVEIVLVGDAFVGRPDPDTAFDSARHLLADADIAFCNLETVVADPEYLAPEDRDPHPRTDEWKLAYYARAGFNVVNLANNVTMWHGIAPFLRCLDLLDESGIVHGGGGRTLDEARRPAVIERNGTKVAFVCRTSVGLPEAAATRERGGIAHYRVTTYYEPRFRVHQVPGSPPIIHTVPDRGEDRAALDEDIRSARAQADVVIVSWHWGVSPASGGRGELMGYQTEMGHFAIDAGADMVAGHHPHVLQPIEVYNGKPILYSLGNFVHDLRYGQRTTSFPAMLTRCLVTDGKIRRVSLVPGWYEGNGPPEFFRTAEAPQTVQHIRDISAPFGTRFDVSEETLDVVLETAG